MTTVNGRYRWCVVLCLVAMVGYGCAMRDPASTLEPASERLIPSISEDGTKFFVFERQHGEASAMQVDGRGLASNDRRSSGPAPGALEARVEQVMERTGYCRDGFFERYRERAGAIVRFRGECREAATGEDRDRFVSGQAIAL